MLIKNLINNALQNLKKISSTPRLDAELILAHILKKGRSYLYTHFDQELSTGDIKLFSDLITQRATGKPIAYILKHKEFWSLDLEVNEHVLIPRPETELLIELALQYSKSEAYVADLGTGSGAIALAISSERPNWQIVATDKSNNALLIAQKNAERLRLNNIEFKQTDWCQNLPDYKFDIIISNPPYISENDPHLKSSIKFEPKLALVANNDGLAALQLIIFQAKKKLKSNGLLILEHGYKQGNAVKNLLLENGYQNIIQHQDLAGLDRAVCAFNI